MQVGAPESLLSRAFRLQFSLQLFSQMEEIVRRIALSKYVSDRFKNSWKKIEKKI